ncbi:hypothetical protein QK336_26410 [Pseudomonas aeruginosa]|nr:hypothetical protein [Pseudomonas aeruginosa]
MPAQATKLRALATLLAVARKGIVTLLLVLALPFAQQAFSNAECLGDMTKRRTGKHLVYRLAFEGFGKTSSGLGHEHSLRWALSTLSQCPLSPGQTSSKNAPILALLCKNQDSSVFCLLSKPDFNVAPPFVSKIAEGLFQQNQSKAAVVWLKKHTRNH